MSFTGGRLKLKGQDGGVKKRKKKKSGEGAEAEKALVVIDTLDNGPSTAVGKVCMLLKGRGCFAPLLMQHLHNLMSL